VYDTTNETIGKGTVEDSVRSSYDRDRICNGWDTRRPRKAIDHLAVRKPDMKRVDRRECKDRRVRDIEE
jgi:hypothetical protein